MHANKKTIMITKNSLLTRSTLLTLALAVLPTLLAQPVRAQSSESPESGFRLFSGLKTLNLGDQRFRHDTHPDDSFLPDSGVPGSAGETNARGTLFGTTLGGGYRQRLSDWFSLTLDMGVLLLENETRDRHQNDNDPRPASSGSFVYSEAVAGFVWYASTALSLHIGKFQAGIEAQIAGGVRIEHGWDRFRSHQSQRSDYEYFRSAGPRIGWASTEFPLVEGTVQFNHGASFEIRIVLIF
jgi:hypothetical protein